MNQREFLYLCARGNAEQIEDAIKDGASINRRAKFQGIHVPPLFVAVMEKNFDAIETLLAHKAKIFPAFMAAMIMEDKSMLRYLVEECRANINCKDNRKRTPLLCAVTANKVKIVKWLVELGADVNANVGFGYTALTYAAFMFVDDEEPLNVEIIKILMDAGANYDEAMILAIKTNSVDLARLLIKNGADVNKQFTLNQDALSLAILNIQYNGAEALPMIDFLAKNGANLNEFIDVSDEEHDHGVPIYTTNLHLAISMGSEDCLEILLRNGADPNLIDSKGRTPLMYSVLESFNMIDILLMNGADPDIGDFEGRTPLTLAVIDSGVDEGIVAALLAHGANVNIQDKTGFTPLMWAVNNHDRMPEFFIASLIRTGAIRTEIGAELYGLAILFNLLRRDIQMDTIQILIGCGADVTIHDKKGATALTWAIMNDDEEVAVILRKAAGAI